MSCKNVMQDCRFTTDYSPNCELNEALKAKYAPGASSEYRYFLQHNACLIMDEQRKRNAYENPTGCKCNFNHEPHNATTHAKYSWNPSATWQARRTQDFNKPIPGPARNNDACCGGWNKYC